MAEETTPTGVQDAEPGRARTRRAAIMGLRLATGLVGLAVAVVTIAAVGLAPVPTGAAAPSIRVVPEPAPLGRVCPGALLTLGGGDGAGGTTPSSVGRASVVAAALGARLDRATVTPSASAAQLLTASAARGALLAGAQSQAVDAAGLRGLATAGCGDPASSSWLVGGSTVTGRTSLLSLVNPTGLDAVVDLRIWSEAGPVQAQGLRGIIVPAGSQKVLPLTGFAPNAASPVVEVASRGGRVVATLQESILRSLDPGGVDLASASSPATRLVIPGVELGTLPALQALAGREDYGDLQPVVRLLDPGRSDTRVRVGIRAEGQSAGTTVTVPLTAGRALDVPLEGLGAGVYTITLDAGAPIVAAARVSSARQLAGTDPLESPVSDLAWIAPAPTLAVPTAFAVPGVASRLHAVNPGTAALQLVLKGQGTPDLTASVPAGGSVQLDLVPGAVYRLTPASPVLLQVLSGSDGRIAAYPVTPPPALAEPIILRR